MHKSLLGIVLLCCALSVSCRVFNVKDYGAKGDGKTKDTNAIVKVIENIRVEGHGTLFFPPGVYLTAPFNLTSNIEVSVAHNATILGSLDLDDYPVIPPLPSYCQGREMDGPRYSTLIHAEHANNITIIGPGIIDGAGEQWWNWTRSGTLKHTRGGLIEIMYANHLVIRNIRLQNSPFWTVHPYSSNDILIERVTIVNPSNSPNTDGIDPDSSSNVHIVDCYVSVGDDVIAIKSGIDECGRKYGVPTANVTISGCTFGTGHGISIGSEMSGGVKNVTIRDCVVNGTQNGVRIKSQRGRGGVVEDVVYRGLTFIGNVGDAILVDMFYSNVPPTNATATPKFRNVLVENLKGVAKVAGVFNCLPESPCENFTIRDVNLQTSQGFSCSNINGTTSAVKPDICF